MKKIIFNCYNCIKVNGQRIKYNNGDIVEMNSERADFFINRGVATLYIEPTEEKEVVQKIIQPKTVKKIINTKRKKKLTQLKNNPCFQQKATEEEQNELDALLEILEGLSIEKPTIGGVDVL